VNLADAEKATYNLGLMHPITIGALFALQGFHVLFLALHDWIPMGTLNDVKGVRKANPRSKLLTATFVSVAPFAIGFAASALYFGRAYPHWLYWWLWISYGLLFCGELQAWWIPYLFHRDPERGALSSDVRRDARLPARAQWHPAEYPACDPSRCDRGFIDCSRRMGATAGGELTPARNRRRSS
jgi:hypothetical protein